MFLLCSVRRSSIHLTVIVVGENLDATPQASKREENKFDEGFLPRTKVGNVRLSP